VYSDEKIKIPKAEFYITNVSNLTCSRCNRFNDHAFKGWQKWSDYEQAYKNWSEKIQINQIHQMLSHITIFYFLVKSYYILIKSIKEFYQIIF
jgi:hypothetical protein